MTEFRRVLSDLRGLPVGVHPRRLPPRIRVIDVLPVVIKPVHLDPFFLSSSRLSGRDHE